jgi:hypothetical protein
MGGFSLINKAFWIQTDRPNDRHLSAKLVPTFADRGCRVVSATDTVHLRTKATEFSFLV